MNLVTVGSATVKSNCESCPLGRSGPCGSFPSSVSMKIATVSQHRRIRQGEPVLSEERVAPRIGIILSGLVKVTSLDEQGNEHLLQLLHPGEFVGDLFGDPVPFPYEAATDVTLCMVPREVIIEGYNLAPGACAAHLRQLMRQQFEQHCFQLAMRGRSSLERLAFWIAAQAPSGSADRVLSIRIMLTRRDLASLLECTAETLSRGLHRLQDMGCIKIVTPERLEIRDPAGLRLLAKVQDGQCRSLWQRKAREWGARPINLPRAFDLREPGLHKASQ